MTRAAFAVMIKFSGLLGMFQMFVEDIEKLEKPDDDDALVEALEEAVSFKDFLKCWANATKMRQWLN